MKELVILSWIKEIWESLKQYINDICPKYKPIWTKENYKHPYMDEQRCFDRLKSDYEKHGKIIVAFDFDNTVFDYHNEGGNYSEVITLLKRCTELGFDMILCTVEEDQDKLAQKRWWLAQMGIGDCLDDNLNVHYLYINRSPIFSNSKKPYYNILLDDRAGLESAYKTLRKLVDYIDSK